MRRESLTRSWPMNSDRRWGRSESSTTLSSGMISGVVISARAIMILADVQDLRRIYLIVRCRAEDLTAGLAANLSACPLRGGIRLLLTLLMSSLSSEGSSGPSSFSLGVLLFAIQVMIYK